MKLRLITPLVLLAACSDARTRLIPDLAARADASAASERYRQGVSQIDLLLIIDDSSGMLAAQRALLEALGRVLGDARGLDWRLGVISSDLGISPFGGPGCAPGGKAAALQNDPREPGCAPPELPWLDGSSADPTAALACIGLLGEGGCGFERSFQAALTAVDPALMPVRNRTFFREDAGLLMVFLSNEDDCSARDPALYDPDAAGLGAWASYRCFEQDIACAGTTADGALTGCASGKGNALLSVDAVATSLRRLREPEALQVLTVVGPPQPVRVKSASGVLELEPSCAASGILARPAIRFSELTASLGRLAQRASICEPQLLGARLGEAFERLRRPSHHCLRRALRDPDRPGCSVLVTAAGGKSFSVPPAAGSTPGFRIIHPIEPGCGHGALSFDPAALPPQGSLVDLACDFAS